MKFILTEASPQERVKRYVDKIKETADKKRPGNYTTQMMRVGRNLFNAFPPADAEYGFRLYNDTKCHPPLSEKELQHKLNDLTKGGNHSPTHKPTSPNTIACSFPLEEHAYPQPIDNGALVALETAFRPGELVAYSINNVKKDGRPILAKQYIKSREAIIADIQMGGELSGSAPGGYFLSLNPAKNETFIGSDKEEHARHNENVASYRHALIEFDEGTKQEHWNAIISSHLPCSLVLDSGNKSTHAWVRVDASNAEEYAARWETAIASIKGVKPDTTVKDPSRYSRFPGLIRNGVAQALLAVNVGEKDWATWQDSVEVTTALKDVPEAKSLMDFYRPALHAHEELIQTRFLCRGAGALLFGQSGKGKSTLAVQFAISFALNRECLGFPPNGMFKTLIIQAEDDDGDIGEMKESILEGFELTEEEREKVRQNVMVIHLDSIYGDKFIRVLRALVHQHRPDLIIINPIITYFGGNTNTAEEVAQFFRAGIDPIIDKYDCGLLGIHHVGKERNAGRMPQNDSDVGLGSVEFHYWPRAKILLKSTSKEGVFELSVTKRGTRLGWRDEFGQITTRRFIQHDKRPGILLWHDVDEAQTTLLSNENNSTANQTRNKILDALPIWPMTTNRGTLSCKLNMSDKTLWTYLKSLAEAGLIGIQPRNKRNESDLYYRPVSSLFSNIHLATEITGSQVTNRHQPTDEPLTSQELAEMFPNTN